MHTLNRLVSLRPRNDTFYVSQGRTVLATRRDGFIYGGADQGLFVHQTRLLSRYRYLIDGKPPMPVALSNVEQHSGLGYYITLPPGIETGEPDQGSGQMENVSQQSLELRVSRYVGGGVHEDIDLTNFTQIETSFRFEIEVDADFADQAETKGERKQTGKLTRNWHDAGHDAAELIFDYQAEHAHDNQERPETARIHRGLRLRIEKADLAPSFGNGRIGFQITLAPQGKWHACINMIPQIENQQMEPLYACGSFTGEHNKYDTLRGIFLNEATVFSAPGSETLSNVVITALEQAKCDLAALRLYDLDHGDRAWTMAAGLPIYIALFGRDTLVTSWQAAIVGTEMMRGTLPELARWQGTETNDWRDEQPGRIQNDSREFSMQESE